MCGLRINVKAGGEWGKPATLPSSHEQMAIFSQTIALCGMQYDRDRGKHRVCAMPETALRSAKGISATLILPGYTAANLPLQRQ